MGDRSGDADVRRKWEKLNSDGAAAALAGNYSKSVTLLQRALDVCFDPLRPDYMQAERGATLTNLAFTDARGVHRSRLGLASAIRKVLLDFESAVDALVKAHGANHPAVRKARNLAADEIERLAGEAMAEGARSSEEWEREKYERLAEQCRSQVAAWR